MELAATLTVILYFSVLILLGRTLTRGPSDVVLLFLLGFGMFYGLRPLLFVLGLDEPFPEVLFTSAETPQLIVVTVSGLLLYLTAVLLGIGLVLRSGVPGWGPFFVRQDVNFRRAMVVVLILTALGTLVSAYLVAAHGGVGAMISAAKFDKALAGLYILRAIPAVGAVVAVATFIEARQRPGMRTLARFALICSFANAYYVFLWGSRSVLVVVGATLVLGLTSRRRLTARQQKVLVRVVVAALLVIGVAAGMRIVRDTLTHGEVQEVYSEATVWRQSSLATNSIIFDAAMLSFRDWPERHAYRGGEDFYNGLVGVIPRAIWEDKPDAISPGKWFRQVYEPQKVNGWPMGAAALWYLNFGWPGLLFGGLLSGLALGMVAAAQRRAPRNGFNTAAAVVTGVYVLGLGWDNETLIRFVIWLVPLIVVAWFITGGLRRPARRAVDASV